MRRRIALIFAPGILLTLSCKEASNPVGPPLIDRDYFPNSIGTRWVYQVYDSILNRQYDKVIAVVDTLRVIPTILATRWIGYEVGGTDTAQYHLTIIGDTVYKVSVLPKPFLDIFYIVPYRIGTLWSRSCERDSVRGVEVSAVRTSYIVRTDFRCFFVYGMIDQWLEPHVGLVKKHINMSYERSPVVELWQLKQFIPAPR